MAEPTTDRDAASSDMEPRSEHELVAARREKLRWMREAGLEPYGRRMDEIVPLAEARGRFDESAQKAHDEAAAAAKASGERPADGRARAKVAGRIMQHRDLGKLVFLSLRDHSGDLQISISKSLVPEAAFELAKRLDYGDIVVAEGPVGATKRGEICIWAESIEIACKSLAPPPEKWHGLVDQEQRSRRRYVDLHANPESMRTFLARSRTISRVRRFMEGRGYLEVETPMMQPIAGGAAARPFTTHHNALDMTLFMRVAPELYLKRLLVGGMPKVFEINRNFRNEGVDRSHNPEFTAMEAYAAFGDCETMLELTESLVHELACAAADDRAGEDRVNAASAGRGPVLPFGSLDIDYSRPFARITYGELFERAVGFPCDAFERVREKARSLGIPESGMEDWLVVNEVFERVAEPTIDPSRPTFVTDWPTAISPLTRPRADRPEIAERWDIFIGGMEVGPAYTELNDPDIQLERFQGQLRGGNDEEQTFRSLDEDFIESLRVGMPPAGGLGLGIDRLVMLLSDRASIRDVILFPLLRHAGHAAAPAPEDG
ncbi:MAG: lysine--tRNA ligase [Phycisphaerales bacterium]|jgi:lysyl-tRNA synthetase class 2